MMSTLFLLGAESAVAQEVDPEFHAEVMRTYSFQPHTLTSEQISRKSADLDVFWSKVKADPGRYLPRLRAELKSPASSPFFLFDGSQLLLSLSNSREDQALALQGIARCDLRDVQETEYVRSVGRLGLAGLDTTEAAFRILDDPKFKASVPEHALVLGQDYSLVWMMMAAEERFYLEKTIARLGGGEKNETAQESLLLLLWYTVTPEGDAAIARAAQDTSLTESVRKDARQLQGRFAELTKKPKEVKALQKEMASLVPANADASQLKALRRQRMNRLSDEALIELDQLTLLLRLKSQGKRP